MKGIERDAQRKNPGHMGKLPGFIHPADDNVIVGNEEIGILQHDPYAANGNDGDAANEFFNGKKRFLDFRLGFRVADPRQRLRADFGSAFQLHGRKERNQRGNQHQQQALKAREEIEIEIAAENDDPLPLFGYHKIEDSHRGGKYPEMKSND